MATRIKNLTAIKGNLEALVKDFKYNPTEATRAAKTIQNELRATIRTGFQPDGSAIPRNNPKTTTRRGKLSAVNKTSKYFNAAFSNATFSGQLVQRIFAKASVGRIILFGKGNHKKYKGLRGKRAKGDAASISDIILGFADRGVKLLGVPQSAKVKIRKQFLRFLRRKQ